MGKLHAKQLAQSGAADGEALVYDSGTGLWVPSPAGFVDNAPSGAVLRYTFDETGTPWANSGSAGALNLTAQSGQTILVRDGVWGRCVRIAGTGSSAGGLTSGNTSTAEPTAAATVMGWFRAHTAISGSTSKMLFAKNYTTSNAYPYQSIGLILNSGPMCARVSIGAANYNANANGTYDVWCPGVWMHLAAVFDGSTIKLYINGYEVASTAAVGTIDYGGHGAWVAGGSPFTNGESFPGDLDDCRVYSTALTAQQILDVWKGVRGN